MPICEKGFANLYININIGFCLNSQSVNQAPGASKASCKIGGHKKSGDTISIYFSVFKIGGHHTYLFFGFRPGFLGFKGRFK